jgi:hypothetical protein
MDFSKLSDRERLVAEQAVETLRALGRAADDAPHGRGLSCMEACIHDRGFALRRAIMASTAGARPEAQKRGLRAALPLRRRGGEVQGVPARARS